ncbi:MAG: AraC family transcriptional regulator [Kiritimatiellae bacterium]|nr:AraC family transcriptional regulator [Kiritimatiellia bacterium]
MQRPPLDIPSNIVVFSRHVRRPHLHEVPLANPDQVVLIVNLGGAGIVVLDRKRIRLRPGQALFIFPHQIHCYAEIDRSRLAWLFVSFHVESPSMLGQLRDAPVSVSAAAWEYVRELLDHYPQHAAATPAAAADVAVALWRLILELASGATPAKPSDMPASAKEMITSVQQYVVTHMGATIRIKEMARALSMSESKLCRDFQRFAHTGLGAYVRRWRVIYACRLMEASDGTLTEIAARCGFTSTYAFSRTFKHVMGLSPSEWRVRNDLEVRPGNRRAVKRVSLSDCR